MPVLDVRVLSHGASLVLLPESATIRITAVDADGPRKRLDGSELVFARTSAIEVRDGKPVRNIDLIPTDGTFCYQVTVTTTVGAFKLTRHITIPDVAGPVRLGDRPDVDPRTFQPTADVIAAWREVTAEVIAARDGSYAARTAAEAAASTASTAATAADTAKTSASASAAAAGVAAGHAGDAATAAGQAATGAGRAASAAEGSARDADASATGALQSKNAAGTSAGSAATSATEAAGSASTATQQATDAAGSATTASQAATTATGAAADAAASKTGADTSAATADARAKDAASSATAAAGSATTADQRATAADQSATAAASSATAADGSKTDAQAARTGAQAAQASAETAQTGAQGAKADAEKARDLALAGQLAGALVAQGVDVNTLTTPGVYRIPNTVVNGPSAAFIGVILVLPRQAPDRLVQIAHLQNGGGTAPMEWKRTSFSQNPTQWGTWRLTSTQRVNTSVNQPGAEFFATLDNGTELNLLPVAVNLGTIDLNAITYQGIYRQNSGVGTLALNYPVAGVLGDLQVFEHSTSSGGWRRQVFYPNTTTGGQEGRVFYTRTQINGSWKPWRAHATQRVNNPGGQPGVEVFTWDDANSREQQLLIAGTALGQVDLNAVTLAGNYTQSVSNFATLALNYPVANVSGTLEVRPITAARVVQRFTRLLGSPNQAGGYYERVLLDGTWSPWRFTATMRTVKLAAEPGSEHYLWNDIASAEQMIEPLNILLSATQSLDVITAPGKYYNAAFTDATLARGYPVADVIGLLEVLREGSFATIQRFTIRTASNGSVFGGAMRGFYQRRYSGGAWGAWSFVGGLKVDQTAGRTFYTWDYLNMREQLVYGDTGTRDITALVTWPTGVSITTGSKVLLRRRGYSVEIWVEEGLEFASAVAQSTFVTLPNGFVPLSQGDMSPIFNRNGLSQVGAIQSLLDGQIRVASSAATAVGANTRFRHVFQTQQSWPTTLPGTAVGSIPNT